MLNNPEIIQKSDIADKFQDIKSSSQPQSTNKEQNTYISCTLMMFVARMFEKIKWNMNLVILF